MSLDLNKLRISRREVVNEINIGIDTRGVLGWLAGPGHPPAPPPEENAE